MLNGAVEETAERLGEVVQRTAARGGKLLIPAFSVGRTQTVIYFLHQLMNAGRFPDLPVYVDSPMAMRATEAFRAHPECFGEQTLRLLAHAAFQRCRKIALYEVVAAVEQEQPRIVDMRPRPGRRVQRRGETIAGLDRRDEALLVGQDRRQPEFAEQRVARGEAMIERTLRCPQILRDGIHRHCRRPVRISQRAGRLGRPRALAAMLMTAGNLAGVQGRHAQARAAYEEALALHRRMGTGRLAASLLYNLGWLSNRQGETQEATTYLRESLALSRAHGDKRAEAAALVLLGTIAHEQGDYGQAGALAEQPRHHPLKASQT